MPHQIFQERRFIVFSKKQWETKWNKTEIYAITMKSAIYKFKRSAGDMIGMLDWRIERFGRGMGEFTASRRLEEENKIT